MEDQFKLLHLFCSIKIVNDFFSFLGNLTDVLICIFLQIFVGEVAMEEKEGIEDVVAEAVIGEEAMVVKWEEGKQPLCPCLVVQSVDCKRDMDCGRRALCVCVRAQLCYENINYR